MKGSSRLAELWGSERVRFLVVGAFNTGLGYAVFALLYLLAGRRVHYVVLVVVSHLISVCNSFYWHRRVTFRSSSSWVMEFLRFNLSYVGALAFSLAALPFVVNEWGWNPLVGAAVITVLNVLGTYTLHKYFSFRRSRLWSRPGAAGPEDDSP